jgi:hypothetical protein
MPTAWSSGLPVMKAEFALPATAGAQVFDALRCQRTGTDHCGCPTGGEGVLHAASPGKAFKALANRYPLPTP